MLVPSEMDHRCSYCPTNKTLILGTSAGSGLLKPTGMLVLKSSISSLHVMQCRRSEGPYFPARAHV